MLDARSSGILERWTDDGVAEQVFRRSGNRMFPGASGPLLAAVLAEEPDTLRSAATAAYCKDVVMQRLTGVRATDVSDGSAPFLDPRTNAYDADALSACGLTEWKTPARTRCGRRPRGRTPRPLTRPGARHASLRRTVRSPGRRTRRWSE